MVEVGERKNSPTFPSKNNFIFLMNKALTTDKVFLEHKIPLRKAQYALLSVALVAAGYAADRYAVLEPKP